MESEIWPCMFHKLKHKGIPLILLNARITKKTFNRCWKSSRKLYKSCMKKKSRRRRKRSLKGGEIKYIDTEIEIAKKEPEIKNFPGWHKYNNSFFPKN